MRLRAIIGIATAAAALLAAVLVTGLLLPEAHLATRSAELAHPPARVWSLLSDYTGQAGWRDEISEVQVLAARNGNAMVREIDTGGEAITYEIVAAVPPWRLVRRIADEDLPFGGSWTFIIEPAGAGATLTITEDGRVYNPLFRFVSRFVIGHTASIDAYLAQLQQALER